MTSTTQALDRGTIRLNLRDALAGSRQGPTLRDQVAQALLDGIRIVEIDATGVRFLDAAGLGELVACRTLARTAGVEFRLSGVTGKARELLLLTGLDRRLLHGPRRPLHDLRIRIA